MGSERGTNPSGADSSLVGWCSPGCAMDKAIPKYDVAWLGFASALGAQQIPATPRIFSRPSAWAPLRRNPPCKAGLLSPHGLREGGL